MAEKGFFEELTAAFSKATKGVFEKHKESNAVVFIQNSITRVEKIVATLDKMLKKRGLDIGATANNIKGKGKEIFDKAKAFKDESKEKGFLATAKTKATDIKSKLTNMFAGDTEKSGAPPEDGSEKSIIDKVKSFAGNSYMSLKDGFKNQQVTAIITPDTDEPGMIKVTLSNGEVYIATPEQYKKLKLVFSFIPGLKVIEQLDPDADKSTDTSENKKGVFAIAKGLTLGLKSKISNIFKKSDDDGDNKISKTEAEKAQTEHNNEEADEKAEKKQSAFSKLLGRSNERADKRKQEIEDEKKAVLENSKENAKKKEKSSWLGKILGAVGAVGGFIGKAIGGLGGLLLKGFGKSIGYLGGFVVKGLGKTFMTIVPRLGSMIGGLASKLVGGGLKAAGTVAWEGAKLAGRSLLPMAGGALQLAGRAALTLATGPVGWVVAAATVAYAGYKLYKYLTKNNVADDLGGKLTRLRLLMYGLNDVKKEHYSKIFDLEMMMKDYIKFKDYKVTVDKLNNDDIDKILDIFKVSRDEKDKYQVLNTWFVKRFMPAYKAFMQALYSVNNSIYLDEIDKMKPLDVYNFVTRISVPTVIYDIEQVPTFDDTRVYHGKKEVDDMLINITNQCKAQANEKDPDTAKKIEAENKAKQAAIAQKQQPDQKKAEETKPAPPPPKQPPIEQSPGDSDSPPGKTETGAGAKTEAKAAAKLTKASGEIYPGTTSLEGISTKLAKEKIYNLDPNVRELFTGMAKEYNSLTGKTIPVNEAFRSYDDQAALYAKMPGKAAKPGNSTHEFGLALDINSKEADELDKLGLMRKYGFTRPIGGEKWHIEPIGVSLDPNRAKKDQNYRFSSIQSSPGKGGDGYGSLDTSTLKKRDVAYQLSIYNKAGGETIDPAKAIKGGPSANLEPKPGMGGKPGETPGDKPKMTGAASPTATQPNTDAKAATGGSAAGMATGSGNPDSEAKPTTNAANKPLEKSENVAPANPATDVGKYAELGPDAAITQAAKMTGMNEATMKAYAQMESSGKGGSIKNKNSSATGLFQIVGGTWKALVKKYGPKYGLPPDAQPDNNYYNALMAMEYAKENLAGLKDYQSAGIDEATAIYLAHHYGASGARKIIDFLKKDPNSPMKNAVSGDAYAANKAGIGDASVQGYVQKVSGKIAAAGGGGAAAGGGTTSAATPAKETYASKSVGGSDAPPQQNNPNSSKVAELNKAVYKPETAPASAYKTVDTASPASAPAQAPAPQQSSVMNPKNPEKLMTDQLDALNLIAKILTSIDGKFDADTFKQIAGGKSQQTPPAPDKSIPKGGVNLSRKSVEA